MEKELFNNLVQSLKEAKAISSEEIEASRRWIVLSEDDQKCFAQALLLPPEPSPVLKRAFRRYKALIK